MKRKKNFRITHDDFLLANRKAAREEEIHAHGKPVIFRIVRQKSKKQYDRNKEKLADIFPKDDFCQFFFRNPSLFLDLGFCTASMHWKIRTKLTPCFSFNSRRDSRNFRAEPSRFTV